MLACVVCVAAAWLYWPSLAQPFHFDDRLFLRDDNIRLGRWREFLFPPVSRFLTWLSLLIQYQAHGSSPTPYHAFNLILHALNSVLVFALLSLLLAGSRARNPGPGGALDPLAAGIGSAVFALHPVQSEAVLLVYQRSTLLAACLGFLSLLCWILGNRFGEDGKPHGAAGLHLMAGVLFLFAVTAKESAVVLPLVFWILEGLFSRRWKPAPRLLLLVTIGGLAGLGMAAVAVETGQVDTAGGIGGALSYAVTQVRVVWLYFGLILGLIPLSVDHHVRTRTGLWDPLWWLALVGLGLILRGFWRARRRQPELAFFGLVFFLFLLPSSSFLPSPDPMFEHRVYASMLGVAGLAAVIFLGLSRRLPRIGWGFAGRPKMALALLTVVVCAGLWLMADTTRRRIAVWSDAVDLWRDAVAKSPGKYRPNFNLGALLIDTRPREADRFLSRAIEIDPSQPLAYRSLGEARLREGAQDEAERLWKQALLLEPNDFDTLLALGKLARERHRYFEAKTRLEGAERSGPERWEVHYQLGRLQLDFGFVEAAVSHLEKALALDPSQPALYFALAEPMARTENWERAIELCQQGLALDSRNASAHYQLALIYRRSGRAADAEAELGKGMAVAKTAKEIEAGRALLESWRGN